MTPLMQRIIFDKPPFDPKSLNFSAYYDVSVLSSLVPYAACSLDGSTQYLSNATGVGVLSSSYWISGWFNVTRNGTANQVIISDGNPGASPYLFGTFNFELLLNDVDANTFKLTWNVSNYDPTGGTKQTASAYNYGSTAFFVAYFNSSNNTIGISVNGGAFETAAWSAAGGGSAPSSETWRVGASLKSTPDLFVKGTVDEFGYGTGVPSTADVAALYAGGAGVGYEKLPSLSVSVTTWHKLRETGATARASSATAFSLTATGTPPATSSLLTNQAIHNGDLTQTLYDLSGNARHVDFAVTAAPVYTTGGANNKPYLAGDGSTTGGIIRTVGSPNFGIVNIWVVADMTTEAGGNQVMFSGANNATRWMIRSADRKMEGQKKGVTSWGIANQQATRAAIAFHFAQCDGATAANTVYFWNSTTPTGYSSGPNAPVSSVVTSTFMSDSSLGTPWLGKVYAAGIKYGAMSTRTEIADLYAYSKLKWSTP